MDKYETDFMIFKVTDGPKVITEALNTKGKEGWKLSTIISVGNLNLCAWIVREISSKTPDPEAAEKSMLSELWSDIKDVVD
tara:strand:+ start:2647 stop:2889 length:243 start_codon:yes stop_codon:yes gene_type:complete